MKLFGSKKQVKENVAGNAPANDRERIAGLKENMVADLFLEGYDAYFSNLRDIPREKMNNPDFSAGYWSAADKDLDNVVIRIARQGEMI